jgi:hypothetical protein
MTPMHLAAIRGNNEMLKVLQYNNIKKSIWSKKVLKMILQMKT